MEDYELDYLIGEVRGANQAWRIALTLTTATEIQAALESYSAEVSDKVNAELERRKVAREAAAVT